MADNQFDPFEDLQERIFEEIRAKYGETAFARWQNPKLAGPLDNPDGYGRVTGSCGDTMEIFLRFEHGVVKEASFRTDGCGTSFICGSFAAELALGRDPDGATEITGETILKVLGDLPEEDRHCAFLAAAALQEAMGNFLKPAEQASKASSPTLR
ncbi:MAG: iron-sulfur cluster assembly scaffold protein [Desulfovibrionales bacterium]